MSVKEGDHTISYWMWIQIQAQNPLDSNMVIHYHINKYLRSILRARIAIPVGTVPYRTYRTDTKLIHYLISY